MNTSESFEALPIPRKDPSRTGNARYRVYKDADNFSLVVAETALEALKASGLEQAYRVERDSIDSVAVLDMKAWAALTEMADKPAPAASPDAAAAPPPKAEDPLSNDDVNKLLNNKS